jgi:hypothetical protein
VGQLGVHQQPRAAAVGARHAAPRPRDLGVGQAGDDDFGIAVEADGLVAALEGRRGVRPVQQLGQDGVDAAVGHTSSYVGDLVSHQRLVRR